VSRRWALAALGVAVVAGLAALVWELRSFAPADHAVLPRVTWPAGQRAVYRIDVRSSDSVVPMAAGAPGATGAAIETRLGLRGELVVEDRGPSADGRGQTVAVRLRRCDEASLSVSDKPAWATAEDCRRTLDGALLVADVGPNGRILEVRDSAAQDALAGSMLQFLVMELQTDIAAEPLVIGDSWQASEQALAATVTHRYRLDESAGGTGEPWRLARSVVGAHAVSAARGLDAEPLVEASGEHSIALSSEGLLLSVAGERRIAAVTADRGPIADSSVTVRFELVGLEPLQSAPPLPADLVARRPTEPRTGSEADRQILDSRIAGLTRGEMNRTLLEYGNSGQLPDHNRFLWRVTGYLERHPEHARDLLDVYRRPEASHRMQGLVLDVLASVGHPVAQEVMRDALSVGAPLEDPRGRRLYQRLGLLEQPTPATADAVAEAYQQRRADVDGLDARLASAYSLGAIAGKLGEGESERAARYRDWLAADLEAAETDVERLHYVRALSNAGPEALAERLEPFASSDSAEVRAAVARALGVADPGQRGALLQELVADDDAVVQREALQSSASSVDAETLQTLAAVTESGRLDRLNVRRLLDIVARVRTRWPARARTLLDSLIAQGIDDPQLLATAVRLRDGG